MWLKITVVQVDKAEDFILLILLTEWLAGELLGASCQGLAVIEYFAGVARVASLAAHRGLRSRAFEINNDPNFRKKSRRTSTHNNQRKRSFMDFNGEAGYLQLSSVKGFARIPGVQDLGGGRKGAC